LIRKIFAVTQLDVKHKRVHFSNNQAPPELETILLVSVWRLHLTFRGKAPLRLPFGTNFRNGKRNGANSLIVCRNHELPSPMQRVSAALPLVIRRRLNLLPVESAVPLTPPLAALNYTVERHSTKLTVNYVPIVPLNASFFFPKNVAPPNVSPAISLSALGRWRITYRRTTQPRLPHYTTIHLSRAAASGVE